jgi:O-antigen/teichoic acid export membrane protein
MFSLKRLSQSRAGRNAAASYLAFLSTSICGLVSVPIAVSYLDKTEMGLWTIVYVIVGYLMWLDMGVGTATGRKIAEAMAKNDEIEINRWWTLSIGVLAILGLLMLIVSLAISPFLAGLLKIPPEQTTDALWIFLGAATISSLGMPFRAYPGLLLAQERFHWVPLVQAIIPWIQIFVFWFMLHGGHGVRSYPVAFGLSQSCGWAIWAWQIHHRELRIKPDFSGWTKNRFNDLFSYSGSIAVSGIVGSILQSIPSLLLARLGGLALVPVYNLTNRGPAMVNSLTQRTTHAFYPNLQKLYVAGEHVRFRAKYREVNQLSVWVSLVGAGAVLAGNRCLITWLAKVDFFAGHWTNVWFACALMVIPFANGLVNLLQYSGSMGKFALISVVETLLGVVLCSLGYHYFELPGIAAVFAMLPLAARAPYALLRGARNCGFHPWDMSGNALITLAICLTLTFIGATWIASDNGQPIPLSILGRMTSWPTWREIITGLALAILGSGLALRQLARVRRA